MVKFEELLKVFEQNKVEYVIVGGVAAIVHGSSYVTNDLDICYNRTEMNLQSLAKALTPFHPRLRGPQDPSLPFVFDANTLKNGMNFTLATDLGDIDLLGELLGAGMYKNLKENSETVELFGSLCFVISLRDLIQSKKAAGRKKDNLQLDELEALLELKSKK